MDEGARPFKLGRGAWRQRELCDCVGRGAEYGMSDETAVVIGGAPNTGVSGDGSRATTAGVG
jgi:hypothetical protein